MPRPANVCLERDLDYGPGFRIPRLSWSDTLRSDGCVKQGDGEAGRMGFETRSSSIYVSLTFLYLIQAYRESIEHSFWCPITLITTIYLVASKYVRV